MFLDLFFSSSLENEPRMTSSFSWCHSNSLTETKLFHCFLPCCFLHCAVSLSGGNVCTPIFEGKKRLTFTIPLNADPSNDILLRAVGGKTWLEDYFVYFFFFFFWLFVFLLFSLLPLYCLALPFSSYSSAKACRQKNCLTQRCQVNYSLFFVNSFPNQMLVHHILVIKQITSGAAEHRHKLCLVLPPNMRQTEMALVLLETVSAKPKPTNCVSLSLTFQALK